jgi:hypothetical protein
MAERKVILDYAEKPDATGGLTALGRFCIVFMACFLLLDAALVVGHRLLPLLVYESLCFLSLGGVVAGGLGVGVAAMGVHAGRWRAALAGMAILCVLATLMGAIVFTA